MQYYSMKRDDNVPSKKIKTEEFPALSSLPAENPNLHKMKEILQSMQAAGK